MADRARCDSHSRRYLGLHKQKAISLWVSKFRVSCFCSFSFFSYFTFQQKVSLIRTTILHKLHSIKVFSRVLIHDSNPFQQECQYYKIRENDEQWLPPDTFLILPCTTKLEAIQILFRSRRFLQYFIPKSGLKERNTLKIIDCVDR